MQGGTAVAVSHTHRVRLGMIWSLMLKDTASAVTSWIMVLYITQWGLTSVAEKEVMTESSLIGPQICAAIVELGTIFSFPFDFSIVLAQIFQIFKKFCPITF